MDKFVELSQDEARMLYQELQATVDSKGSYGIYKIRVYMDDSNVKFKVNEHVWSPPMGKMVAGQ